VSGEQDRLDQIRARRAAVTPPPWEWDIGEHPGDPFRLEQQLEDSLQGETILKAAESWASTAPSDEDAEFIAHAPTDITYLLGEVARLRGLLGRLERLGSPDGDKACPVCYADANGPDLRHDPACWLAAALK
jgi:hypothetical protein